MRRRPTKYGVGTEPQWLVHREAGSTSKEDLGAVTFPRKSDCRHRKKHCQALIRSLGSAVVLSFREKVGAQGKFVGCFKILDGEIKSTWRAGVTRTDH